MRIFITSLFAHIFLNSYIGWRVWHALPPKKGWRVPMVALIVMEVLLYGTIYIFRDTLPDSIMYIGGGICLIWLIAMVYFTIILMSLDLMRLIHRRWPIYPKWATKHYLLTKQFLLICSVLIVGTAVYNGYRNGESPIVKEVNLTVKKESPAHKTLKIVVASDWHIGHITRKKEVQNIVQMIKSQHPDIILLPGDIIDHDLHIAYTQKIDEDLRELNAPLGVYAVMGNHEYRGWPEAKIRWLEKSGITLLIDSVASPDGTFYLIGRDDFTNEERRKSLRELTRGVDTSKPIIVMDHQPERFSIDESTRNKADIAFYGHTHGGQIWPHNVLIHLFKPFVYGYRKIGGTHHYVTSGVGMAGPPLRIGSRSEITVVTVTFE